MPEASSFSSAPAPHSLQEVPGTSTVGALIIRIGLWGPYTILIRRNPQNSIGMCIIFGTSEDRSSSSEMSL